MLYFLIILFTQEVSIMDDKNSITVLICHLIIYDIIV